MKTPIGLAPMYGVTDFPTRLWFHLISGCEEMTTPFLRVTETYPHKIPYEWAPDLFDREIAEALPFNTIPQLMASCPKRFVEAYELLKGYSSVVEINCGCPSPKVVGHGAGSSLLREVDLFKEFISYVAQAVPKGDFCVKIRTGYENTDQFYDLIHSIKNLNLKKLTIHGRTKEQKYSSYSRWDLIAEASEICSFPVFASGDVTDLASYDKALLAMPKVQGVIIGRGALKRPWIFNEIKEGRQLICQKKSLYHSLLCYGFLIELCSQDFNFLKQLILKGVFLEPFLLDEGKWLKLRENLESLLLKEKKEVLFSKATLGRMKMMMGYLLKGVLDGLEAKPVLRAKGFSEFEKELAKLLLS